MTFSKSKAKETRELTRTLEKTLEDKLAYSETAVIDNAMQNNETYQLEKEMEQIYEQKAKDAQIRSRKKWVEYGENTMLIYQVQKRNGTLKGRSQNYQMMRGI